MRCLSQAGVVLPHLVVFVNLDAWDGRAEAQSLFRVEREAAKFLDFFDVDEMLGAANAGAQLDDDIGAAAEWARVFDVGLEDADGLIERARGFVGDRVQGWEPPSRVKIIPAFDSWIAYLPLAEKGIAAAEVMWRGCEDEPRDRLLRRAELALHVESDI